jgi:Sulfotransferase family
MRDSSSGPLFVVGLWRSGTSLLYSLLNQHSQIALMYEGDLFLLRPLFRGGNKGDWQGRWEFWNSALSRHHVDRSKLPAAVPDFRAAAMSVWKQYGGEARVTGEKSPDYYDCMETLARDFPNARFLVIWRDLTETCRSIIRARSGAIFFSKPGLLHRAIIGYHKMKLQCEALETRRVPLHQIHYEEMIEDPVRVMTGICEFLGLEFEPQMASLQGSDRSAIYTGSHHQYVKGEQILGSRELEEVLTWQLRSKIERYVNHWRKQYQGSWPLYPHAVEATGDVDTVERLADEFLFRFLRGVDSFTETVYCYAPYRALERYRARKNRRFDQEQARAVAPVPEAVAMEAGAGEGKAQV